MSFYGKIKAVSKELPVPLWVAGTLIPGGLTVIVIYMIYKISTKDNGPKTMKEFIEYVKQEDNDESR